jgi:hypothetical protein
MLEQLKNDARLARTQLSLKIDKIDTMIIALKRMGVDDFDYLVTAKNLMSERYYDINKTLVDLQDNPDHISPKNRIVKLIENI